MSDISAELHGESDRVIALADGLEIIILSENEILIQYGTRSYPSELLRDSTVSGHLSSIFAPLLTSEAVTVRELLARLNTRQSAEASAMIAELLERGILTDPASNPVDQYLRYTFTGASAIGDHSVSVVGAGPLGSRIAHGLAEHGIGRLSILDDRRSNSIRHGVVTHDGEPPDNGKSAANALVDMLQSSGYTDTEALEGDLGLQGIEAAAACADFLVLALERPDPRVAHMVNRSCATQNKPWILTTIDGNYGLVGPLISLPDTACYNCYEALADAATPHREIARKYREHLLRERRPDFSVGLPAYADIAAGYTTLAVVRFMLGASSFCLGRVLVMNFAQMLFEMEDVLKMPRCPECSLGRVVYRPAFSPDVVNLGKA